MSFRTIGMAGTCMMLGRNLVNNNDSEYYKSADTAFAML
jgi:hypothetical protein